MVRGCHRQPLYKCTLFLTQTQVNMQANVKINAQSEPSLTSQTSHVLVLVGQVVKGAKGHMEGIISVLLLW